MDVNKNTLAARALFAECLAAAGAPAPRNCRDVMTVVFDLRSPLGKKFWTAEDGSVAKEAAVATSFAAAMQFHVPDVDTLAKILTIVGSHTHAAVVNAVFPAVVVGAEFRIGSRSRIKQLCPDTQDVDGVHYVDKLVLVARVKSQTKSSTWQLLDRDVDRFTPAEHAGEDYAAWITKAGQLLVGLERVSRVFMPSSSTRVLRDGEPIGTGNGHTWIKVKDADDVERTRVAILARAVVSDLAWLKPRFSRETGERLNGRGLFSTVIDYSTWSVGRLVFDGCPVVGSTLSVAPAAVQVHRGEFDALDTRLSTIDQVQTLKVSKAKGAPLRITSTEHSVAVVMDNLDMATVIETEDGTMSTVAQHCATLGSGEKVRCQAPFRSSSSMAAFLRVDKMGQPFVFDVGTGIKHVLPTRKQDGWTTHIGSVCERARWVVAQQLGGDIHLAELAINEPRLVKILASTCWDAKNSKMSLVSDRNDLITLSPTDFAAFGMWQIHGGWIDYEALGNYFAEVDAMWLALPEDKRSKDSPSMRLQATLNKYQTELIVRDVKLYRQVQSRAVTVDMYAKHATIVMDGDIQRLTLPFKPLKCHFPGSEQTFARVVADYKQYWPMFDEWLDAVAAARFSPDRRRAFQWLTAPASWGKGFLMGVLEAQGLSFEISTKEIEKVMGGDPCGVSLTDCLYAWILFVDEWKAASREIKQLNNTLNISPKNQLRSRVSLYTKLFASAEVVRSLVESGVEHQFGERFSLIRPAIGEGYVQLEQRPLFYQVGKADYYAALVAYVGRYLTARVEHYRRLGRSAANIEADRALNAFHAKHGIENTYAKLDDMVAEIAEGLQASIFTFAQYKITEQNAFDNPWNKSPESHHRGLNDRLENCHVGFVCDIDKNDYRLALVCKAPATLVKSYLDFCGYEPSVLLKLTYKTDQIIAAMGTVRCTSGVRVYEKIPQKNSDHGKTPHKQKRGFLIWADKDPTATEDIQEKSP